MLRFSCLGLFAMLLVGAGCASDVPPPESDAPQYVTTIPPLGMILAPMVEGRGQVTVLLDPGDSPHTYDPRPSDLRAVHQSQGVFYGADHLDAWAADLPAARHVAMLPMVPDRLQLPFDGLGDDAHSVEHGREEAGSGESASSGHTHGSVDPHFWMDPQAVRAALPALADTLCAADTAGCATYQANADSLATVLSALDQSTETLMAPVRDVPVMLSQPFFRYFLHRYGPRLVGIVEPQPAREPSPRQIQHVVTQARRTSAVIILTQHQLPPRAAEAVAEAANLPMLALDPLGGVPGRATYPALIEYNATRVHDALAPLQGME